MAPRRSAPVEEEEQEAENELTRLQFNEPLSWRPGRPISTDQLLRRLDRLSKELGEMEQETTDADSLTNVAKELASHQLITHKDKGVRAYTACCVVDLLRLCAPNAPFTESQLKDIFHLIVNSIIPTLFDPSNSYNNQHKYVLRSLAEIKSIALLPDIDGNEGLQAKLFSTIFDGVSKSSPKSSGEQLAKDVEFSMRDLLGVLIDEATGLPQKVVDIILAQFLRAVAPGGRSRHDHMNLDEHQPTLLAKEEPEAYQMVKYLCQTYPEKMSRFVGQYFADVIMDATNFSTRKLNGHKDDDEDDEDRPAGPSESDLKELHKAHNLVREVWKAAPMVLQNVVPQVEAELSADNVPWRQLATETLGDMISGIGAAGPPPPVVLDPTAYPPLKLEEEEQIQSRAANVLTTPLSSISFPQTHPGTFQKFLKRKNDKAPAIRTAWATSVGYILSTSAGGIGLSREEETELVQGLADQLEDTDEKVRLAAVKAIETFKFQDVIRKLGPHGGVDKRNSVFSNLADRCRDRRPAVHVEAMSLLAKLWSVGAGELLAGNEAVTATLSGIPERIINCYYANDKALTVVLERVLYECLVPLGYPPAKKTGKSTNGNSQSKSAEVPAVDSDAVRAERLLLMLRSLSESGKKVFYVMQGQQPTFAKVVSTFVTICEAYNGGVMDEGADRKTASLEKTIQYLANFFPDSAVVKNHLHKFARANDRRNYNLIRYVVGEEHDFRTAYKALKELNKRIMAGKDAEVLETLLPLLYRAGNLMLNRSYLSIIMDYSKTDKDGLGGTAHELLNAISQRNPDLFKTHVGQLCKDLVDQAPTSTKPNDPVVVDTLKACSAYSRKYPQEVPMDRSFTQTIISYALYGRPFKAAKYAVNILLSKKDDKSMVNATDLVQKIMKDWTYGSANFLNKLTAVGQLELLAPNITEEYEDRILNMTVQQILLEARTEASDKDPDWVEDAQMDEECQAKCIALKTLINRLMSIEDQADAKEKAKPVWKLLRSCLKNRGELCKTKDTPKHYRARLRLLASQLLLKLCTLKHFDDVLSPEDFNTLAFTIQDPVPNIRQGFVHKLQKYLASGKLRSRYYTILFLAAFEPNTELKNRIETWVRSRARYFEEHKQPVFEAIMARLLSLLAHHPDYGSDLELLADHARYILFHVSLVSTESNLGLIHKYAERVKQTEDGLDPTSTNHRVLSDLAQAIIRKWQEKKNWTFNAQASKVGIPVGLYTALKSHAEAQEEAEKQYIPDGIEEKLDSLLREFDRKKKRKSTDDRHDSQESTKRVKTSAKSSAPKEPKPSKPAAVKKVATKPKVSSKPKKQASSSSPGADADRRRSGRSRNANRSYIERDSSEDDEEMLEGVAEWEYENSDADEGDDGDDGDEGGETKQRRSRRDPMDESEDGAEAKEEEDDDASPLSDMENDMEDENPDENEDEDEEEEKEEEDVSPPSAPPKATNGRTRRGTNVTTSTTTTTTTTTSSKAKPVPKGKTTAAASTKAAPMKIADRSLRRGRKRAAASSGNDDDDMNEDSE